MMGQVLDRQFGVIAALLLREARLRHGRLWLGYAWALIEPLAMIALLVVIFARLRQEMIAGQDFAMFFATGVLPFTLFRATSHYASAGAEANRPLFLYPAVRPVDAVLARVLLEAATMLVVTAMVLGALVMSGRGALPAHPLALAPVLALSVALATGVALCLSVARDRLPALGHVYGLAMAPAFLLSGIFYSLHALPPAARELLIWNPLIHVVEQFRAAWFAAYRSPETTLVYPAAWALALLALGLVLITAPGRRPA